MISIVKDPLFALINDAGQFVLDIERLTTDTHFQYADGLVHGSGFGGISFLLLHPYKVDRTLGATYDGIHFTVGTFKDNSQHND